MNSGSPHRTILIVAYDFPPRAARAALRTAAIAKYLALNDWKTIVLTCAPDGTVARDEEWAEQLEVCGVEIIRTKPLARHALLPDGSVRIKPAPLQKVASWLKQWTRQPDEYVVWRREAKGAIDRILSGHNVNMLYAAAPPFSDCTLVEEIADEYAIPFAVDYGDVWLDNPTHFYPTPLHRKKVRAMEESIMRKAAMIFTTTRRTKEDLLRNYRFLMRKS